MTFLIKITIGLMAIASTSFGADVGTPISAPPSIGFSVLRMIGALCLVFALLFGGVWAYRNSSRFAAARGRASKLKILESRALGHRHSIFVVGYDSQRLLLSTSPTGVTMLTHLPEATAQELEAEAAAPAPPNFSSAFLQALTAGRK
jgi:flagellar biogenesis protein FliO